MKIQTSRHFFARLAERRLARRLRAFAPVYRSLSAALLLTSGLGVGVASADDTWTGTTSGLWSVGSNWSGGQNPSVAPYGTLFFSSTTNSPTTDDIAALSENALFFNASGTNPFVINGAATSVISLFDNGGTQSKIENNNGAASGLFTLNNSVINFAAGAGAAWGEINAVTGGITFGASNTLNVNGSQVAGIKMFGAGQTTTFNNTVAAGTKYFATTGATGGTVAVSGAFTSGDFYLMNGSTLNVSSTGTNFNAAAVRLGGDFGTTLTQDLTKGATFNLTLAAGGQNYAGVVNTVSGNTSGALVLNSQNTSNTNTLSGHLALDSNLTINETAGTTGTLAITQARAGGAGTLTGTDIKGFTLTLAAASGNTINFTGDIYNSTGTGNVTKTGVGALTLSGTNTYTGATTIAASGGTVNLGAGSTTGTLSPSGTISIGSSATFAVNRSNAAVQGTDFSSAGISGAGGFTQSGAGTTTLNATNTYTGATTINNGVLRLAGGTAIADNSAVVFGTANAPILDLNGTSETVGSLAGGGAQSAITLGAGTLTTGGDNTNTTYAGVIFGTGGLAKIGTGTQTLNTTGASTVTATTGNLFSGGITVASGGGLTISGFNSSGTGLITTAGTLNITQPQLLLSGGITINGGTTTLSSVNTAGTGTLTLNNGTLAITNTTGAQLASVVLNGGTFAPANAVTFGSLSGSQGFTASANGLNFGTNNTSATYTGNIAGALGANVIKTGSGTQILNGTVATTGTITANGSGGALEIGGQFSGSGNVAVNAGTLRLNFGANNTVASNLIGAGALTLGGGTLAVAGRTDATNVAQGFSGTSTTAGTASNVTLTNGAGGGTTAVNIGAVTSRGAGSAVNFNLPSGAQSTTNGVLTSSGDGAGNLFRVTNKAYATVNGSDFAAKDATDAFVTALTGSTAATTSSIGASTANSDIIGVNPTVAAQTINTLRFAGSAASTLTLSGALNVNSGGILVSNSVTDAGSKITGSSITAGATAGELIVHQFSAQPFTLDTQITGATALVKAGPGTLIVTKNNTNALSNVGAYVDSGTLQFGTGGAFTGVVNLSPNDPTAVLDLNNQTGSVGNISSGGTTGGYVNLGASGTLNDTANYSATYSGALVGGLNSTINKTGGSQGIQGQNQAFYGTLNIGSVTSAGSIGVFGGGGFINATVNLTNASSSFSQGSSGQTVAFGNLSGTGGTLNAGSSASTNITFNIGYLGGASSFAGVIANGTNATTPGVTNLGKFGSGTQTLSGTNTYTGATQLNSGGVIFDYSGGNTPLPLASALSVGGATATFKGAPTGATAIATGVFGVNNAALSQVAVNSNGGSGTTLTLKTSLINAVPTLGSTTQNNVLLFDTSNSGSSVVKTDAVIGAATTTAAGTETIGIRTNNGLLTTGTGGTGITNYRADVLIKDATGIGFATNNASTTISRYTGATTAPAGNTATLDTTNYIVSNTTVTRTGAFLYNTLQLDSSTASAALSANFDTFTRFGAGSATSSGRGVLATGSNGATVSSGGGTNQPTYFYNYQTGSAAGQTLTLNMNLAGSSVFNGTGLTVVNGTANSSDQYFQSGVTRLSTAQSSGDSLTAGQGVYRLVGGVLEIGADLTGATSLTSAADFSRSVGAAAGQVQLLGDTGFSAYGQNRTVNLGGAGRTVVWGTDNFLASTAGTTTEGNNTFKLSSAFSDSTIEFQNGIALGSITRQVDVANGTADIDARLTGVLSGVIPITQTTANGNPAIVNAAAGLTKLGAGRLELTAANTYTGRTTVSAGTLSLDSNSAGTGRLAGTTSVAVNSGGTLLLTQNFGSAASTDRINNAASVILAGGTLNTGGLSEGTVSAPGGTPTAGVGALTMTTSSVIDLGNGASILAFANSSGATWTGTLSIYNYTGNGSLGGGTDELFFGSDVTGLTPAQLAQISFYSDALGATFIGNGGILADGEVVPVPEPATLLGGLLMAGGLAASQRRRLRGIGRAVRGFWKVA